MKDSDKFLITATLFLVICLFAYNPNPVEYPTVVEVEDEMQIPTNSAIQLYSHEIFYESDFSFVRADINHGYAIYEVYGHGDAKELKTQLLKHLRSQGYESDLVIMVLDDNNTERVREII